MMKLGTVAMGCAMAAMANAAGNPPYELLPTGAVKPQGWMRDQLRLNLEEGITGHYDAFHANVAGNLFARQERTPGTRVMGRRGVEEKAWWAGEHEGYWHDGLVRAAILVGSEQDIGRVRAWVEAILGRYGETGYIGIYSPEARFPEQGYDGELWTQSRAMEALLAWHEFSGDERFLAASRHVLPKLERHTNPDGGFVAGKLESIAGVPGGGDEANEYCSKTEAIVTLGRLFQYDGNLACGAWSERCALNAAQGARFHPANTATTYLSRDNRLRADNPGLHGGREIFSAGHRTAACCTLNATRLLPAYVASMWYRSTVRPELLANLYGASELATEVAGIPVRIVQRTAYPFGDRVEFRIGADRPVAFDLVLRVPPNSGEVSITAPGAEIVRGAKTIRMAKRWQSGDIVSVDFGFRVARRLQPDGRQAFYEWGPLVFALPIEASIAPLREIERNGEKTGYFDYAARPADASPWAVLDDPGATFVKIDLPDGDPLDPWSKPPVALEGALRSLRGEPVTARLVPLGSTLLRRTTFPLTVEFAREAAERHKGTFFRDEDDPMRDF